MEWIARIIVFTAAMVFGAFAASFFAVDDRREVVTVDVSPPPTRFAHADPRVTAEDLLGTWTGTWDHANRDCTLQINRVDGNNFSGVLTEHNAIVRFEGVFYPNTRMVYFNETKIDRLGAFSEWSLGKNNGSISPDGRTMLGSGVDKWGQYGWAVSKE